MASKSFRVAVATEKIEFDLEYINANGRGVSRKFHCRPMVPAMTILKFASAMGEDESGTAAIGLIQDLFKAAILPEDYPGFLELLEDPDVGVDVTMYTEIASWLAEKYVAGRPTGESLPSTQQGSSHGTDSTDGASPKVLTYSRPEPVAVTR